MKANNLYSVRREVWPVRKCVALKTTPDCDAEIWYYDPLKGDNGPYNPTALDLLADDWELC